MMEMKYLMPTRGGRWAISREVHGRWLALIESTPVDDAEHPAAVLSALGVVPSGGSLDRYFPDQGGGRAPTLELLGMFVQLGVTMRQNAVCDQAPRIQPGRFSSILRYVVYNGCMLRFIFGILILIIAGVGFYLYSAPPAGGSEPVANDPKNATYEIQEKDVTLTDGNSIVEDSPSSKTITAYFGNEAKGDLDADGDEDVAFILIQNGGGSGTFVYVVAALREGEGYRGTNGILLGDRVAPQATEIKDGKVVVNYADRKPDEPMAVQPSVGITLRAKIEGGRLVVE
jgi:hypothetical protein